MRSTPEPLVPVKRGRVEWQDEPRSLAEREVERDLEARLVGRPLGEGGAVAGRKEGEPEGDGDERAADDGARGRPPEREHCEAERGGPVAAETLRYPHRWSEQASERDGDHEADEWREDEEESPVPGRDGLGVECASTYPDRDRRRGADRGDVDQPDPPPSARVVPRERRQRKEERGRKPGARESVIAPISAPGASPTCQRRAPRASSRRRSLASPRRRPIAEMIAKPRRSALVPPPTSARRCAAILPRCAASRSASSGPLRRNAGSAASRSACARDPAAKIPAMSQVRNRFVGNEESHE